MSRLPHLCTAGAAALATFSSAIAALATATCVDTLLATGSSGAISTGAIAATRRVRTRDTQRF